MIREEYALTSWRGWADVVSGAIRGFVQHNGSRPDLLVLNSAMHRRMSIAACRKARRFSLLRGVATDGAAIPVVVEDDMGDNAFALIGVERETRASAA